MEKVVILLAAYNGGPYIRQTIQSVLEQDYRELHLVLSDDGSSDGTAEILEEYRARYPRKITHYRSCVRFGNAQDHFMHLLARFGDADYLMFCDQDDIWHPDKVTRTLQKMKETEIPGLPALVHTDLRVVDGDLKEIDPSFIHYSNSH